MSRLFEQAGSMSFQGAATSGGLTREFRLNLRPDVNGDCHGPPPKLYGTAALRSSQTWATPQPLRPPWVAVTHGPVSARGRSATLEGFRRHSANGRDFRIVQFVVAPVARRRHAGQA